MNNQIRSLLAKCQQEAGLETRDTVQRLEKISIWRLVWKILSVFNFEEILLPANLHAQRREASQNKRLNVRYQIITIWVQLRVQMPQKFNFKLSFIPKSYEIGEIQP